MVYSFLYGLFVPHHSVLEFVAIISLPPIVVWGIQAIGPENVTPVAGILAAIWMITSFLRDKQVQRFKEDLEESRKGERRHLRRSAVLEARLTWAIERLKELGERDIDKYFVNEYQLEENHAD